MSLHFTALMCLDFKANPQGVALGVCHYELNCGKERVFLKILNMECGDYENRVAMKAPHKWVYWLPKFLILLRR